MELGVAVVVQWALGIQGGEMSLGLWVESWEREEMESVLSPFEEKNIKVSQNMLISHHVTLK